MRHTTVFILFIVLVSLSSADEAFAERFDIGLSVGSHSSSMDAISADSNYLQSSLQAFLRLPELSGMVKGLTVEIGAVFNHGELSGRTFRQLDNTLNLNSLLLAGRLKKKTGERWGVYGEFGVGMGWSKLTVTAGNSSSLRPLAARAKNVLTRVGGGAELKVIRASKFSLSIRTSIHYELASTLRFLAKTSGGDERIVRIKNNTVDFGSTNTSGFLYSYGVVGSF